MTSHEYLLSQEKRALDIASGLSIALGLGFPATAAGLAIRLFERQPAIFRAKRIGVNWESFEMLKLTTMQTDAHLHEKHWQADASDPRITKLGRLIRKFDLNEVPQAVNILRGQMSIVGGRPVNGNVIERNHCADPGLYKEWSELFPLYKPGLIGQGAFAERDYRSTGDVDRISTAVMRADIDYWTHASLGRDLRIIGNLPLEILGPHIMASLAPGEPSANH